MTSLILKLLPAIAMLFWAARIFFMKDSSRMKLFMAAGMLVGAVTLFTRDATALFMFPFCYLSVREITAPDGQHKWDWAVLLPSILMIPFSDSMACRIFLWVQVAVLSVFLITDVSRYNRLMSEYFDTGSDTSDGLGQIVFYLVATVIVIAVMIILPEDVVSLTWLSALLFVFIAVLQFLMGYSTYYLGEYPKVVCEPYSSVNSQQGQGSATIINEPAVISESAVCEATVNDSDRLLLQRVIDGKLYLDPMVSLVSLAETLNTNRTYLSRSIHTCYNQNFSDFINNLRIQNALELMRAAGPDVNIKDVAMQSGYNHLQSFYRNFALIMEMTPKEWLSRQGR